MSMTRKEFLGTIVKGTALGALAAGTLAACGGDDGGDAPAIDAPAGACSPRAVIATNHGHALTVSTADVEAGTERVYDIMGTSTHTHSVTLTAAHFATLAADGTVNVVSTSGGAHTHNVTVNCA